MASGGYRSNPEPPKVPWSSSPNMWRDPASITSSSGGGGNKKGCGLFALTMLTGVVAVPVGMVQYIL